MKVLANETKRILAVLLSVAMIFAYVPNTVSAYADEPSDNNAPAIEGSETGDVSAPAEDAKTEEKEDENGNKETVEIEPAKDRVKINKRPVSLSDTQPLKQFSPRLSSVAGKTISFRFRHPLKASLPML